MVRYFLLTLFALSFFITDSQAQSERIRRLRNAGELYLAQKYLEAATEYETLMMSPSSAAVMGVDAKADLAHCYLVLGKPERAEILYREVMPQMVSRPEAYLYFGESLMLMGKVEEAKQNLLVYNEKRPDDPRGPELKARCDMIEGIRPVFDHVNVRPQEIVNRKITDEFASTYCGNALVFASDRITKGSTAEWTDQKRSYLDLYIANINEDGQLEVPKKFPFPINSPSRHDGPASFSRDGKTVYFSQSIKTSNSAEQLSLQIAVATYADGRWSSPEVLPIVEMNHIFSHPCLSPDGTHLYFMSNRPGGYGGTDIWVSTLRDGRWMPPQNAGSKVNTDKNEGYPYMHPSGALYFASKGHANYGGYDIFRVRPLGNGTDWLDAENLGRPFNSHKDDTYFLLSDEGFSGFISSKRDGDDNIYQFTVEGTDSMPVPVGLTERTAPDFLDLEEVKEEVVAETSGTGNTDDNMSDWKLPEPKEGIDDENFVDKMLSGGSSVTENGNSKNGTTDKTVKTNPSDNGTKDNSNSNSNNSGNSGENPVADNNNNGGSGFSSTDNSNSGNKTNKSNLPTEANPTLVVDLHIVDANISVALKDAKVMVTNLYNKEMKEYSVSSNGTVEITLKPNQKYQVRATCSGYYEGSLPIATENATHSETKKAYLPLVKKG